MQESIEVPKMGESVASGIIAVWLKSDGDRVEEGDELFELETDKATLAVPSTVSGRLIQKAAEGDEVEVGQVVAYVDTSGASGAAAASDPSESGATTKEEESPVSAQSRAPNLEIGEDAERGGVQPDSIQTPVLSPAVRRIVDEYSLSISSITPTGPGGRITKEDALSALLKKAESAISGSNSAATGEASTGSVPSIRSETREPMSTIRKRIAENLVRSQAESAHLTTFNEVDMSGVMRMRTAYKDQFAKEHGVRLGFMSFFSKACALALQTYPKANSAIDGDVLVTHHGVHIGIAVSTDRGLLVPVLRDVDKKSFAEIESEIASYAARAKEKRIGVDELSGGTFTITNGGVFGSLLSTPIPTPGQAAILGMHTIQNRPVAIGETVEIRPMMYLALTYDHRIMDGREAVSFLVRVKSLVEDPSRVLLGI